MNSLRAQSTSGARSYLWQVIILSVIFTILGIVSFTLFDVTVSLRWLPLIPIALWPRTAPPIPSIIALFLLGVFQDWVGYAVPGQWALVYVLCFAVLRPFQRIKPLDFVQALLLWIISTLIAFSVLTLSGRFIYGVWPAWGSFINQMACASVIFPMYWFLRHSVRVWMQRKGGN